MTSTPPLPQAESATRLTVVAVPNTSASTDTAPELTPVDRDPHGLVPLLNQLWRQFNSHGDPLRMIEVNVGVDEKERPTLEAETYYIATPYSMEIRTFEDEAHLARYLTACLKYDTWAEKVTRTTPLYRSRKEYIKTPETADTVRETLRMSKLVVAKDGTHERTLQRTNGNPKKPDMMTFQGRSDGEVFAKIVQLSFAAVADPSKTLVKVHAKLLADAERAEKEKQKELAMKLKAAEKAAEKANKAKR